MGITRAITGIAASETVLQVEAGLNACAISFYPVHPPTLLQYTKALTVMSDDRSHQETTMQDLGPPTLGTLVC